MTLNIFKKMNIKDKFENFKQGFKLYPISIILSIVTFVLLSYTEMVSYNSSSHDIYKTYEKTRMIILISLMIFFMIEQFIRMNKINKSILYYIGGFVTSILVYFFVINKQGDKYIMMYIGLFLAFFVTSISLVKNKENFSSYIISIVENGLSSILYILTLIVSSLIILGTIRVLFDIYIVGYIYAILVYFCIFIIGIPFFISNLVDNTEDGKKIEMGKIVVGIVEYIAIPMLIIYSAILYVYLGKIVVTSTWPKGIVSHLIIWYQVVALIVLVLVDESNKKMTIEFKNYFPKFSIPILIMMMISLSIRIREYGITENRYFILMLGIFVLVSVILYAFRKNLDLRIFSILLVTSILISLISPINAFEVSKYSQNKRLKNLLIENNMLENNKMVRLNNPDELSEEDRYEISNIVQYFSSKHSISDIKYLEDDFNVEDMKKEYGFEYEPNMYYKYENDYGKYKYSMLKVSEKYFDISEYDNLVMVNHWENGDYIKGDYIVSIEELDKDDSFNSKEYNIFISKEIDGKRTLLYEKSLNEIVNEKLGEEGLDLYNIENIPDDSIIYKYEDEKIKLEVIPNGIDLVRSNDESEDDDVKLNSAAFYLMFTEK